MDFGGKYCIFVLAKRRKPINTGFSPLFLAKIGVKKVVLHYELVISTLLRKIFLGVCGFFLRNVGGFLDDVERLDVKRYLFSRPHFLRI